MSAKKGFAIWLTGMSGAGKSTVADYLHAELRKLDVSNVEILDGDVIRTHLSKGLGFSREDRDTNVLRIGWVCQLLVKNDVPVMTAAISPYRETRDRVRAMVEEVGGKGSFIEIYVNASLDECARRDVKGLYAKAFQGEIKEFTGVSDPYEPPLNPELMVETEHQTIEESAGIILSYLKSNGFIQL